MPRLTLVTILLSALATGSLGLGACGGRTVCDDAVDQLNRCMLPSSAVGSCDTDRDRCEARCLNTHSCDEIRAAFSGTPNAYSACDDACNPD
jgi:hypothetical protein